jgi:hypothetical protein
MLCTIKVEAGAASIVGARAAKIVRLFKIQKIEEKNIRVD